MHDLRASPKLHRVKPGEHDRPATSRAFEQVFSGASTKF